MSVSDSARRNCDKFMKILLKNFTNYGQLFRKLVKNAILDCKQPKATKNPDMKCNCRQEDSCSLPGKCLTESVVYQATVTRGDNQQKETYVGHTAGTFKVRYYNHTSSFRNPEHKHSTELSKYIWQLKQSNIQYSIRWKILKKCKAYSNKTKCCKLCLHEKFIIIYYPKLSSLNSRNELIFACIGTGKNSCSV
jgi:hypothetical protein